MTTARLEELARKCDEALSPETPDIASVLEIADVADLARCARAWATLEAAMMAAPTTVELMGCRGRGNPWAWYPGSVIGSNRYCGATAIEAVEAGK